MIRSLKSLRGDDIVASDGVLGDVHDFFFDDHSWQLRYLVIDTGNWLPGRRVMVSPRSIASIDAKRGKLKVNLSREEIESSPGIAADAPVSRQHEIDLADHFRWPRYWEEFPSGVGIPPMIPSLQHEAAAAAPYGPAEEIRARHDPNLRSAAEVEGYHVAARDGQIGHIDDFLVDDVDWTLRYLVVDTRNWLPGRHVLVAPAWTRGIDWGDQKLLVDADRETIEQAPEYEPGMEIDAALQRRIFEHYGQTPRAAE